MRQKNNSCQNQPGSEAPDDISLFGRKSARGRGQRADMHGMSRRKCIEPLPGKRDPSPMSTDRPAVRPLLVENNFEQMRHRGGHKRGQQNMIAGATIIRILATTAKPPTSRQNAEDMLIRHVRAFAARSGPGLACAEMASAIATSMFVGSTLTNAIRQSCPIPELFQADAGDDLSSTATQAAALNISPSASTLTTDLASVVSAASVAFSSFSVASSSATASDNPSSSAHVRSVP